MMNYSMVCYILGKVLKMEGVVMLLPALVGAIYREKSGWFFLLAALLCYLLGSLIGMLKCRDKSFYALEGYVTVALSWILLSVFGALPFYISGEIPSYIDALFETISGFTTTGASILSDVECLSKCMIFWRSFTHWIGGMGVLVFVLAVLPLSGDSNMYLMQAESPGPSVEKLVPRLRNTALILYCIYAVMTVIQMILLIAVRMPVFDAVTISFGTAGTGGFGIKNDSMAGYSVTIQNIVTVFMILFGINFNLYFLLLYGKIKSILKSEELRGYLGIIFTSIVIISFYLVKSGNPTGTAIKDAAFQVGSIITTTGYSTTDFNEWDMVPKMILLILMFIGACAGSTGGGMKVSRLLILFKTIKKELFSFVHPRAVKKVKMDGQNVEHETVRIVNVYFAAYIILFFTSVLLVCVDNYDLTTSFSAVAATFNNIGPGLGKAGPMGNFGFFSDFSKIVMSLDMLIGRLEIFPMLLLFSPYAWRRK